VISARAGAHSTGGRARPSGASLARVPLRQRIGNLLGVSVPFGAFIAAVVVLWGSAVGVADIAILVVGYVIAMGGVTVGWHRLLTHGAFRTSRAVRYAFAVAGTFSVQGSVIDWVADHRMHHAHADDEGDPHSPYEFGDGFWASVRGLWHAHVGWLFTRGHQPDQRRFAPELVEDRGMVLIDRAFPALVLASLALPAGIGYLISGTAAGALTALLWGGLVRVFLGHHVTFSINSICHFFGTRRFETDDRSTNVFWLAPLSFGEAWHNNHHAFPRSARHGLRWWEIDPGAILIRTLRKLRLVWDVVEISPERQREKERGGARFARAAVGSRPSG
jgi:stearoyl-CoA desaturase (delta-9 desaturase)